MVDAYALSGATYDRFNRAASRVLNTTGGGGPPMARRIDGREVLQVSSSTIGTYGYPAKFQLFDKSTGTYANDPDRPQTVYLIDPAGGAYTSGQYADAVFAGYRGAADESVYEAVKQTTPGDVAWTSLTLGTGARTSGPASQVVWTNGFRKAGFVFLVTGGGPAANATVLQLSYPALNNIYGGLFQQVYPNLTNTVNLAPYTVAFPMANTQMPWVTALTTTNMFVTSQSTALNANTAYAFCWQIFGD